MKVGVLGSGIVGRTLAAKLSSLSHEVTIGTRDVEALLARSEPDQMGNEPFAEWSQAQGDRIGISTFADATSQAELVVNATAGSASLRVLELAGADNLGTKVLVDIANPLDFSRGFPPSLSIVNTDSLAEQIQRAFPESRVVKSLNTVTARVMVEPREIEDGDHHIFVSGDDEGAKGQVTQLLESFGWKHIVDLGGLSSARAAEMYLPLWVSLMGALNTPMFNIRLVGHQG